MGQTYNIACKECKETIWVGQGSYDKPENGYLYKNNEKFQFLLKHKGHELMFYDESSCFEDDPDVIDVTDYEKEHYE